MCISNVNNKLLIYTAINSNNNYYFNYSNNVLTQRSDDGIKPLNLNSEVIKI